MNAQLLVVALLSAAAIFGFLAFLTRRHKTAVVAHRVSAPNPLQARVVSAPSAAVAAADVAYDLPMPMDLRMADDTHALDDLPAPHEQSTRAQHEQTPLADLPELPPLPDVTRMDESPDAAHAATGAIHDTFTASEFPPLPPLSADALAALAVPPLDEIAPMAMDPAPEISNGYVAPPLPMLEEHALPDATWPEPTLDQPAHEEPNAALSSLHAPAVAPLPAEPEAADPIPTKRRGFMDQPGDMPWLTPIESLPPTDSAEGSASDNVNGAAAEASITWTRAFTDAKLPLEARVELVRKAIMLDDSQMLDHVVEAFLQDMDVRPAIHAALEFFRPRCARVLYFTLLQHGDTSDAMLAVDGLISYGNYRDLVGVLSRETIGEYAAFQLAAKVDLDRFFAENNVPVEVANKLRGCVPA